MGLIRFKQHPQPGYYDKDGRFVTTSSKGYISMKPRKMALASGNGGGLGGGGLSGPGFGGGFGGPPGASPGDQSGFNSNLGGSSANVDRYNPVRDRLDEGSVIEDWIPRDASGLDEMFRLMYHRDHIAGTIVDLICDLIWSPYDLTGVKDAYIRKIYEDSMDAIDVVATMPDITREFLVLGRTVSSMIFDKSRGVFSDIVSHDPSFVRLTPIPIKGFDPKIDLIPSPSMRQFIDSEDPRDVDARKVLPEAFLEAIRQASGGMASSRGGGPGGSGRNPGSIRGGGGAVGVDYGGIPLDPINTLFIPRRVFNYDMIGTSFFTRLISFWALEKALLNATMTSARRRSRALLHIKAGIDNVWEPTAEEIDNIAGMFIQADEDPVGAVVATRTGVDANEIRDGRDFYKWADEWDLLNEGKLRALGANDALLTGDATYSNQETAKLFFMEKAKALRDMLTARVFYNRLFPLLARIHGFRKRTQAELNHRIRIGGSPDSPDFGRLTQRQALEIPDSELIIPTVSWQKQLVYDIDEKQLDIYERLKEQDVPVTLKQVANAGGVSLDDVMSDLEEDAALRKRVAKWKSEFENWEEKEEQDAKLEFIRNLQNINASRISEVVGSTTHHLGPLRNYIFWDDKGNLAKLSAKKLSEYLGKIDPSSNRINILGNRAALEHDLIRFFEDSDTAQLAHYLMYREGLTIIRPNLSGKTIEMLSNTIKKTLNKYAGQADIYQLGVVAREELKSISSLAASSRKTKEKAADALGQKLSKAYKPKKVSDDRNLKDAISVKDTRLYSGK